MKVTLLLAVAISFACLGALCSFGVVYAYPGYGRSLRGTQKNWMSRLDDRKRLFLDLTIPGTHSSASDVYGYMSRLECQAENVKKQLEAGVRFLDIRLGFFRDKLFIKYGFLLKPSRLLFKDVLRDVADFLNENQREVVIMRVRAGHENNDDFKWKQDIAEEVIQEFNSSRDFACQRVDCAIGPSRGKIIFLEDGFVAPNLGLLNYLQTLGIQQDNYFFNDLWRLWYKWEEARDLMINVSRTERNTGVINFFSGSGGASPYFVASGQSDALSGLSLWTGISKACWDDPWGKYPDFPRKDCAFCGKATVCSIHFRGTNNMLYDWLRNGRLGKPQSRVVPYVWPRRLGILALDFPDNAVIDEMIKVNFVLSNPFKGEEYIPKACVVECPSCIAGDIEIATEGRGTVAAREVAVGDRVPGLLAGEWCEVVAAVRVSENGTVFGNFTSDHLIVEDVVEAADSSLSHVIRPNGAEAPARHVDLVNIATECPAARAVSGELFTPLSTAICSNLTWGQYVPLYSALLRIVAKTGPFWFDPSQFSAAHDALLMDDAERLLSPGGKARWGWDDLPEVCSVMAACAADGQKCEEFERMFAGWVRQHVSPPLYALIARVYPNFGNPNAPHGRILDDVHRPES